jgi:hypothetical protein
MEEVLVEEYLVAPLQRVSIKVEKKVNAIPVTRRGGP